MAAPSYANPRYRVGNADSRRSVTSGDAVSTASPSPVRKDSPTVSRTSRAHVPLSWKPRVFNLVADTSGINTRRRSAPITVANWSSFPSLPYRSIPILLGDPATDLSAAWLLAPSGSADHFFSEYARADEAAVLRARGWALLRCQGLIEIGRAGEAGLPGGKPTWKGPALEALSRVLASPP